MFGWIKKTQLVDVHCNMERLIITDITLMNRREVCLEKCEDILIKIYYESAY